MPILNFPPVHYANEEGLIGVGGDLEIESLLLAYKSGIFPWPISNNYPLAWFSPDPRGVLFFDGLRVNRSLKRTMNKSHFVIKYNQNFSKVIEECSKIENRNNQTETWITEELKEAYINLFHAGHAYSVEAYDNDELVGGVYGVIINQFISGESMFYKKTGASKICMLHLMNTLNQQNIHWLDTQMITETTRSLGGVEISRVQYMSLLKDSLQIEKPVKLPF